MLGELADEEFDELRLIVTRARNGHKVDRVRFRALLAKLNREIERMVPDAEGLVQKIRRRVSEV